MNEYLLQCNRCKYAFEEPKNTYTVKCPGCGATLFIPSRKDWESMQQIAKENLTPTVYEIDPVIKKIFGIDTISSK